jgi:hypothetical protein
MYVCVHTHNLDRRHTHTHTHTHTLTREVKVIGLDQETGGQVQGWCKSLTGGGDRDTLAAGENGA